MADVRNRDSFEKELTAAILLLWAGSSIRSWINSIPSARDMAQRIEDAGIARTYASLTQQQTADFLDEIEWTQNAEDISRKAYYRAGEKTSFELANRLADRHYDWQVKREVARRTGEPFDDAGELYREWEAEREAVTSVATVATRTESVAREFLRSMWDLDLEAVWRLDPLSNWCDLCLRLADTPEYIWSNEAPFGPPRHPNCRCFLEYYRIFTSAPYTRLPQSV